MRMDNIHPSIEMVECVGAEEEEREEERMGDEEKEDEEKKGSMPPRYWDNGGC